MCTSTNSLALSRYAQLSKVRDALIELSRVINWELFRFTLSTIADKPRKNEVEENALIREVAISIEGDKEPHKLAQQDSDARFTKGNGECINGHKDHVNVDRNIQLIKVWKNTPAQGQDSQALEAVFRSPEKGDAEIFTVLIYWRAEKTIKKPYLAAFRLPNIKSNCYAMTNWQTTLWRLTKTVTISKRLPPYLTCVSWYRACNPSSTQTHSLNKILYSLAT